jgi:hypothetical protein
LWPDAKKERHWIIDIEGQPAESAWQRLGSPFLAHGVAMVLLGFLATLASFCEFWVDFLIGATGILASWIVTSRRVCVRERKTLLREAWTWKP